MGVVLALILRLENGNTSYVIILATGMSPYKSSVMDSFTPRVCGKEPHLTLPDIGKCGSRRTTESEVEFISQK